MEVRDVMTAQVAVAAPTSTVAEVARIMAEVESGAVPVVESGRVLGLITDRDIVLRVVAERRDLDTPVSEVMTAGVETCREDDDVAEAARHMGDKQIRRLIVLDDEGDLAGILSLGDVARQHGPRDVGRTLEEISENTPAAH